MNPLKESIITEILKVVSSVTGISIEDIKSKTRTRKIVSARQMYCAYMEGQTAVVYSLQEIGASVNIDHTSVLHNKKVVLNYCDTEPDFKKMYEAVCEEINISPTINELISMWIATPNNLNIEELGSAIELIEGKVRMLQDWLSKNPINSYRTKVLMDVRDYNRELIAKRNQLENQWHQQTKNSKIQ
jgi:hypothetical protein